MTLADRRPARGDQAARGGAEASVRLRSGGRVLVTDDLPDGWLVESAVRLLPGTIVELVAGPWDRHTVRHALVAQSEVAAIDRRGVRYRARLQVCGTPVGTSEPTTSRHGNELPTRHGHFVPITGK